MNLAQGSDGNVSDEEVVAEIAMTAPAQEQFLISATIPVPPGTFTGNGLSVPLSVRNIDGIAAPTQVESVTRYPDESLGSDVVQVLAHVRRPDGAEPGQRITYQVGLNPHARKDLLLTDDAQAFLAAPGSLRLVAHDANGHSYSADLLKDVREDGPSASVVREGQVLRQVRTHSVLAPDAPGSALPHLFGAHAFVTSFRGEDFVALDLHVHNGMDGLDPSTPLDDAFKALYFRDLVLRTPPGWEVSVAFENPWHGQGSESGGWRWEPLIQASSDGSMHLMPKQGRLVRRLVVHRPWATARARAHLRGEWRAFVTESVTPTGLEGWSWWNPDTARYFNQNQRLPVLNHVGLPTVRGTLSAKLAATEQQVASGSAGSYPFMSAALGWAHPWGVAYGGMAGGDEIWPFDGIPTAWAASREGYRLSELVSRCYVDRQPQALYDVVGDPTRVEDLLHQGPQGPYVNCWFYEKPIVGSDPFGFSQAPQGHNNLVESTGRRPAYADELESWSHIDHQHLIRYTRNLKVLLWLGNDALARELLSAATETVRLSYHEFPIGPYYDSQPTQLLPREQQVLAMPGQGVDFRRSECWGLDAAMAVYASGSDAERQRLLPWLQRVADLIDRGQSTCTGNIEAAPLDSLFGGQYRVRQTFEEVFIDNTLQSLRSTVLAGKDPARCENLRLVLIGSATSTITPPFWDEAAGSPAFHVGVAPVAANADEFCFEIPAAAFSGLHDNLNPLSTMAYGYQQTGDTTFLLRAQQMMGGGNLLQALKNQGLYNLEYSAPLLALLQQQAGE